MKKIYIIVYIICFLILISSVYGIDKTKIDKVENEVKDKKIIKETMDAIFYQMDENIIRVVPTPTYWDGEKWKKANTNIKKLKYNNFEYGVEDNHFKVYFDSNSTDNKNSVKIKRQKGEIDFSFEGLKKKTKISYNKNLFVYEDIDNITSITFEVTHRTLKEYINISEYPKKNIWTFELDITDLDYELKDNRMYFYDSGKLIGVFDTPIVWDSTIENVIPANFSLRDKDNKVLLDLIVNDTWLQNAEYPIVIDPTYDDFEYDLGYQGGLNASLWNWNHTQDGSANYFCTPSCSAVHGWDVGVYAGRLNLFASTCHIDHTCSHYVDVWTINNTDIFNASNIANISYSFDASGYLGTPQSSCWFNYWTNLEEVGTIYEFERRGNPHGTGSHSDSGEISLIRNSTDATDWDVYKNGVFQKSMTGTPTSDSAFRIHARSSITGTGSGFRAWISSYTYYIDYGLISPANEIPELTGISSNKSIYNASDTVWINASGVTDADFDALNMTCCKGYSCIPTTSGNILQGTKWYERNQTEYHDISGYFTAGTSSGIEYIRCNLRDNQSGISDTKRTQYNIISNISTVCLIPNSIWCDDFLYTTTFCQMGWDNIPDFWDCNGGSVTFGRNTPNALYEMFLGSDDDTSLGDPDGTGGFPNPYNFIFYYYFPETKNPIISMNWDMTIGNDSKSWNLIGISLAQNFNYPVRLYWRENNIYSWESELCTDCWIAGQDYRYKISAFFQISPTYFDNESREFVEYNSFTYTLYQNDILIASDIPFTYNVSELDSFYLNRVTFQKSYATNMTLDNIVVYKGTVEDFDDTYEWTETPNGTTPPEFIPPDRDYFGWKSKEDYCKNNIECCTLTNSSTGMRYIITDQICFMRSVYSRYSGKNRSWIIQNQYIFFILLIIVVMFIITIIIKWRNE